MIFHKTKGLLCWVQCTCSDAIIQGLRKAVITYTYFLQIIKKSELLQRSKHSKFDRFKQSYGYTYMYVYSSQSKIMWFQYLSFNGFLSWVMQENLMFSMLWKKHIHNNFYKWNNYAQIVVTSKQKRLTKSMKNINETTIFSILICFSVTHDHLF